MFLASLLCAKITFNTIINPACHAQDWRHPKKGSVRLNMCQIHMIWYGMIWYDMIWYDMIYDMILLLTASGLPPGGSSTVHIYTQTIHRATQNKQYIEKHKIWEQYKNFGRVRAVPRLGELYPGIRLTTEEKARKSLSQGSRQSTVDSRQRNVSLQKKLKWSYTLFHLNKNVAQVALVVNLLLRM